MQREELKISEQLREVLREFSEEWKIEQDGDFVILAYQDAYEYFEIFLELNEYGNVIKATYTYASLDEEIIAPYSCHECWEDCTYYNAEEDECSINDDDIENEINEWVKVKPLETRSLAISRTIVETKCFLDIPHYHLYKGYIIVLKNANNYSFKEVYEVIDLLIEIYEQYLVNTKSK